MSWVTLEACVSVFEESAVSDSVSSGEPELSGMKTQRKITTARTAAAATIQIFLKFFLLFSLIFATLILKIDLISLNILTFSFLCVKSQSKTEKKKDGTGLYFIKNIDKLGYMCYNMRTVLILEVLMQALKYNTAAREAIVAFFSENPDRQYTTEQVFENITNAECPKAPGKSTVYRLISKLWQEGYLRRFRDGNDSNYLYQYACGGGCEEHLHMKCTVCGKVYHLECEKSEDLMGHVLCEHGFKINGGISMLYGQCSDCSIKD